MIQNCLRLACRVAVVLGLGLSVAMTGVSAEAAQTQNTKRAAASKAKVSKVAAKKTKLSKKQLAQRKKSTLTAKAKRKQTVLQARQKGVRVTAKPKSVVRTSLAPSGQTGVRSALDSSGIDLQGLDEPLRLKSSSVLVVDQNTHEVLLSKNDKVVLPIASLTKLMTGLLVVDAKLPLDEEITITQEDVDTIKGSSSRLAVGTRLTRGEALHLALMSSENRAAHALGRTYPGGLAHFVGLMNKRAAELGMRDTRYVEPTGLSSQNQSSAQDLARLVGIAHQRPLLRELSTSPSYEVMSAHNRVLQYRNSNRLVDKESWNIGLQKTGYISEAGRCLVMQASVAGRQLIMVFLDAANSAARVADAERVRHWVERTWQSSAVPSHKPQV